MALLILLTLLALLVLLLPLLLISHPRKGGILIILPMSRLACALLLRHTSGALLLAPGCAITPATTGRACSLAGRHILAGMLVADILVGSADILLDNCLLSGDCRIIHLDLLVPASRSHTSGMLSAGMRGRGLAPRPRAGTSR
jgi:hypothetical protein